MAIIPDHTSDTVCALATATGEGAVGVIRLSGPQTIRILKHLFTPTHQRSFADCQSHMMHLGVIKNPSLGIVIDEVLLVIMSAPRTYTREDMAEIHCHGSPLVLHHVLELLLNEGAVLADPGEFTKRAFLNGRIDLLQAEAVIDIIRSRTSTGLKIALDQLKGGLSEKILSIRDDLVRLLAHIEAGIDFVEEDISFVTSEECIDQIRIARVALQALIDSAEEGRILRDGLSTVIIGRPNVGKSSLLNTLLEINRAIVTSLPGTTRDVLEEYVNVGGVPLKLLDTAGIRSSDDVVEQEGIRRAYQAFEQSELALIVIDGSTPLTQEDYDILHSAKSKQHIVVINKSDLGLKVFADTVKHNHMDVPVVTISATLGIGIEQLKATLKEKISKNTNQSEESSIITQVRHKNALCMARDGLNFVFDSLKSGQPGECLALDLRQAIDALGQIVGVTTTDDILGEIFKEFCIGK